MFGCVGNVWLGGNKPDAKGLNHRFPDRAASSIADTAVGGGSSSEARENLRTRFGWTQGIGRRLQVSSDMDLGDCCGSYHRRNDFNSIVICFLGTGLVGTANDLAGRSN